MNIQLLSKSLLEEAISSGTITIGNIIRPLSNAEILSCIKYILTNSIDTHNLSNKPSQDLPEEMFINPLSNAGGELGQETIFVESIEEYKNQKYTGEVGIHTSGNYIKGK